MGVQAMRDVEVSLPFLMDASRGVISLPPAKGDCGMWCVLEGGPATPHRWGPSNLYLCGYR